MSDQIVAAVIGALATVGATALGLLARASLRRRRALSLPADKNRYGIELIAPAEGARVMPGLVDVTGTYRFLPPDGALIVINATLNGSYYWPSVGHRVEYLKSNSTWRTRTWISGDTRIIVAIVGPGAKALFEYYMKVGMELERRGEKDAWICIEHLPPDVDFVAVRLVFCGVI